MIQNYVLFWNISRLRFYFLKQTQLLDDKRKEITENQNSLNSQFVHYGKLKKKPFEILHFNFYIKNRKLNQSPPPVCCWYTSIVSPSSISNVEGVSSSWIGWPSNLNRTAAIAKPCNIINVRASEIVNTTYAVEIFFIRERRKHTARSQYAFISFLRGVCFLILNCTTPLSCPRTFKFMCSDSLESCKIQWNENNAHSTERGRADFEVRKCYLLFVRHFHLCPRKMLSFTIYSIVFGKHWSKCEEGIR